MRLVSMMIDSSIKLAPGRWLRLLRFAGPWLPDTILALRLLRFTGPWLQDTDICRQSTGGDTAGTCKSLKIIPGPLTHDAALTGETIGELNISLSRAIRRIIMPHNRITACSR